MYFNFCVTKGAKVNNTTNHTETFCDNFDSEIWIFLKREPYK